MASRERQLGRKGEIAPPRPRGFRGRPHYAEDLIELIHFVPPWEEGVAEQHLSKHASHRPHIDCRGVTRSTEKKLRGAIPKSDHDRGVRPQRMGEVPSETEVTYFESALLSEEEIGCLEVTVEDPVGMKIRNGSQEITEHVLDLPVRKGRALGKEGLELVLHILHYHEHLVGGITSDHLDYPHYVLMLESP